MDFDVSQNVVHSQPAPLVPLSRLTLDSATAQFAASAVVNTVPSSEISGSSASEASKTVVSTQSISTSLQNGPKDGKYLLISI